MSEIADLTYNVVAFSEIMSMVWKRLNDHGKNWRHVYKAMTLMEYLIKTGSERVAQQCRENIYAVQTLKDFQYIDRDGKDQGVNVREKAKQLVTLLKDEERLREERIHALKTKEKMAQTSSASSAPSAPSLGGSLSVGSHSGGADPEQAWPQSSGEEDLQLQLALAMSKEEAEQEERLRRGDDLRLQMAIEESKREKLKPEESALMELSAVDPWGAPAAGAAAAAATVGSAGPSPPPTVPAPAPAPAPASGPWGATSTDPWGVASPTSPTSSDPWGGGAPPTIAPPPDPWGETSNKVNNVDPWGSSGKQLQLCSRVASQVGGSVLVTEYQKRSVSCSVHERGSEDLSTFTPLHYTVPFPVYITDMLHFLSCHHAVIHLLIHSHAFSL